MNYTNYDLVFELVPITGNPHMYIKPDSVPLNDSDFVWKSEGEYRQRLIVTPEERIKHSLNDLSYFIKVNSTWFSTFKFEAYPLLKDDLMIDFDFPEYGELIQ